MATNGQVNNGLKKLTLRTELRPGDIGWVIGKHGTLYNQQFSHILRIINYEIFTARKFGSYFENFNSNFEQFWFAEIDGVIVGFANIEKESDSSARLNRLLVDTAARGRGVGSRLVDEAIQFARDKGYESVVLRTHPDMRDAARIYSRKGFQLVCEERTEFYGPQFIVRNYELKL